MSHRQRAQKEWRFQGFAWAVCGGAALGGAACGGAASSGSDTAARDAPGSSVRGEFPGAEPSAGAAGSASTSGSTGAGGSANVSAEPGATGSAGAGGIPGLAQPLCGTSVYVGDQASLDALEGCDVIYGSLSIYGVRDLRPLHALREVLGDLDLYMGDVADGVGPNGGHSLEGLENLEHVGGHVLSLQSVQAPTLAPLAKLRIDEPITVRINDCDQLQSLAGLNLSGGFLHLQIAGNDRLETLAPLRIADTSGYAPTIEILGNPNLSGVAGLEAVTSGLRIQLSEIRTTDLAFLANLRVAESLSIQQFPELTDASLPNLERLDRLDIGFNERLSDAPEYPELRDLGMLWVASNPELREAPRLPVLDNGGRPSGLELVVTDNPKLERFEMPGLAASSGILIEGNGRLASVSFPALAQIAPGFSTPAAGSLRLFDNESLTGLGFEQLAGISDSLYVVQNPLLDSPAIAPLVALAPARVKLGLNLGDVPELAPCPWVDDDECDELPVAPLCAPGSDERDCSLFR